MNVTELKKAAKEVKTELGFEEINLKGDLKAQLIEVAELIGADGEDAIEEDELNDLTKETKILLLELRGSEADDSEEAEEETEEEKPAKKAKGKKKDKKKETPKAPENETELIIEQVKEADLDELKALIKSEGKERFPIASRGLPLQKNLEKLQAKALKDLGEDVEEEEKPAKEKPAKEKPAKEKPAKEKKAKVKKGPGVIATIVETLEKAGEKGITREAIHEVLVQKFPERAPESLMNTVKVQVPSRINKERFEVKTLDGGKYAKA